MNIILNIIDLLFGKTQTKNDKEHIENIENNDINIIKKNIEKIECINDQKATFI